MTRHARNCTAGAVYTYHEKKKDAEASGYGTQNQRVGKDSVKDYDCCCLTLQPCRDPMITKDGYLFDKEAILEYIIRKKNEISRKMKEYEKQKKKEETELADLAAAEKESKLNRFVKSEKNIVSAPIEAFRKENPNAKPSVSNMAEGRDKVLPSFWIPSKTPAAKSSTIEKPPSSGGVFDDDDDEDFYDKGASTLHIPEEVMKAIDQVIPSSDPLDDPEFNPVNYIDAIFPTEQSLSNIDDVIAQLECKIHNIDDQIGTVIRVQTSVGKDGRDALADAQRVIRQLFLQTLEIKTRAERSEGTVKDIMGDIKQLDCAKRNLTTAITTLNHLHMLMGGVDTLKVLTGKRQYREIVMPLQGIIKVMKNFHNYTVIPQIKKLADEVQKIQNALSQQITQDFNEALTGMNAKNFTPTRNLAEACLVIDILDPKVKCELLKWFVGVQLGEYQVLFGESEDNAWLDKIDQRYIWFKKHLLQCEDKFGAMFPPHWDVSERITVEFCLVTKAELTKIMAKRLKEIDVKLLLYAIQKTHSLEQLFADRFTGNTILEKSKASVTASKPYEQKPVKHKVILNSSSGNLFVDEQVGETEAVNSVVGGTPSLFNGIIGECFIPYLYIYIESLDRNLYELIEKFTIESKRDLNYGQPVSASLCGVLPSSADLFVFYKKCLVQCNQLNNGLPMLSLSDTFKKYLREYAIKILQNNLPKSGGTSSSSFLSTSVASITWDLRDISSASSIIQNFLREGEVAQLSKSEVARICCILTTAEYCLETTQQLEEKLQEKVDPCLVDNINLSQEQDIFYSVISNCVQLLVQDLEMACEPALSAMTKIQWHTKESVEDQSSYVTVITSLLKASVPFIKDCLFSSRKYFTQFCIRFANSFILKFIQSLYKCKPLSVVGAEQLLLDTHMLKTVLLELPSFGSQVARKAPVSYTKVVAEGMTRGEMILKVVMAPIESEVSFVDQFLKLLPESDIQEFQKVLEMKGF